MIMVIGGGLVLPAVFILLGRQFGAGNAAAEELPIGLVVFGVPTICAALFWWRFSLGT